MANLRPVTATDLAQVAYLVLKWDSELPEHCRLVRGCVEDAQRAAQIAIFSPDVFMEVLEEEGEVFGGFAVAKVQGLFTTQPYGQLLMWYVHPAKRGGLFGLRLLNRAIEVAQENGMGWLEAYPWADDTGAGKVLERLGFKYAVNTFTRKL